MPVPANCERLSPSPRKENKSPRGPADEGRRWNQYVAHLFSSSLFLPLFPRFSTHRRNLCYLLVTFIWSPRVLDLSLSLLSHSLSPFFLPLHLLLLLFRLLCRYRLPTARSLEQSGTSYSGFQTRRQGSHSLSPSFFYFFLYSVFCGRHQSFWFHHLVFLIRDSLISRTTSVKVDNRTSTRAATKTRTTLPFPCVNHLVLSHRSGNSRTNSIQREFLILIVSCALIHYR